MQKLLTISLLALTLAACQTREERQAELDRADDARCQAFGAKRGTPAYTNCRLELERNRILEAEARRPVVVGIGGPGIGIGWGIGGYCRSTPWGVRCY
jgi:hypothetical protein